MSTAKYARFRPGTPIDTDVSGAAGAAVDCNFAAVAGKTAWCTGFEVSWDGTGTGTVADVVTMTPIAGTDNTITWKISTTAGTGGMFQVRFPDPIAADAVNHALHVQLPATANRAGATITMHGFYL